MCFNCREPVDDERSEDIDVDDEETEDHASQAGTSVDFVLLEEQ
jgi:hypothetical protein